MSLERQEITQLDALLRHPGWELLRLHFHEQAQRTHEVAMGDGAASDRERADAALRWRTIRKVVQWPEQMVSEYLSERGADVDESG